MTLIYRKEPGQPAYLVAGKDEPTIEWVVNPARAFKVIYYEETVVKEVDITIEDSITAPNHRVIHGPGFTRLEMPCHGYDDLETCAQYLRVNRVKLFWILPIYEYQTFNRYHPPGPAVFRYCHLPTRNPDNKYHNCTFEDVAPSAPT